MFVYICVYIYVFIYIYIYMNISIHFYMHIHIHICIASRVRPLCRQKADSTSSSRVYSVICDSGSVSRRAIFSPRETSHQRNAC